MSRDAAMAEAQRLKAVLAGHGVRASIELQAGRPWSGDPWWSRKYALVNHHTAGAKTGLTPSLALVKRGRTDLPGPLCNGYGGRDHVYRIITLGLANHPGQGGPITLAGVRIPKDSARISTWGTEWEHDGVSPWPEDMREFMGRANAALLEWLGRPIEASIEHSTWAPNRKIDRRSYTASTGQAEIRKWAAKEDDVTPEQLRTAILSVLKSPEGRAAIGDAILSHDSIPNKNGTTPENKTLSLRTVASDVEHDVDLLKADGLAIRKAVTDLNAKLDKLGVGGVNPDALAVKVADLLAARLAK